MRIQTLGPAYLPKTSIKQAPEPRFGYWNDYDDYRELTPEEKAEQRARNARMAPAWMMDFLQAHLPGSSPFALMSQAVGHFSVSHEDPNNRNSKVALRFSNHGGNGKTWPKDAEALFRQHLPFVKKAAGFTQELLAAGYKGPFTNHHYVFDVRQAPDTFLYKGFVEQPLMLIRLDKVDYSDLEFANVLRDKLAQRLNATGAQGPNREFMVNDHMDDNLDPGDWNNDAKRRNRKFFHHISINYFPHKSPGWADKAMAQQAITQLPELQPANRHIQALDTIPEYARFKLKNGQYPPDTYALLPHKVPGLTPPKGSQKAMLVRLQPWQ